MSEFQEKYESFSEAQKQYINLQMTLLFAGNFHKRMKRVLLSSTYRPWFDKTYKQWKRDCKKAFEELERLEKIVNQEKQHDNSNDVSVEK